MSDVRNCRRCGRMFQFINDPPWCNECKKEEEGLFLRIREYLDEHPKASIPEVANALEVDAKRIINFLKQGRLEVVEGSNMMLECEKCGNSIKSGRLCENCSNSLSNELKKISNVAEGNKEKNDEIKSKKGGGMRYLHKDD